MPSVLGTDTSIQKQGGQLLRRHAQALIPSPVPQESTDNTISGGAFHPADRGSGPTTSAEKNTAKDLDEVELCGRGPNRLKARYATCEDRSQATRKGRRYELEYYGMDNLNDLLEVGCHQGLAIKGPPAIEFKNELTGAR